MLVSGFFAVTLVHFQEDIKNELSIDGKVNENAYFSALLKKNINLENIKRRMRNLPGVFRVELDGEIDTSNEVKKLKSLFGSDMVDGLASVKYRKITVELEKGIKIKSLTLIQEYLSRLVGKDYVTIGEVKKPRSLRLEKQDWLFQFLNWANTYALIICVSFWFITHMLILKPLMKHAFVLNKFQRKSFVEIKMLSSGILMTLLICVGVNIILKQEMSLYSVFVLLIMGILPLFSLFVIRKFKKFSHEF